MSSYNIRVDGACNINSMAIGPGAVAIGHVNGDQPRAPVKCGHCGAPVKTGTKTCPFCHTDYPVLGSISISFKD